MLFLDAGGAWGGGGRTAITPCLFAVPSGAGPSSSLQEEASPHLGAGGSHRVVVMSLIGVVLALVVVVVLVVCRRRRRGREKHLAHYCTSGHPGKQEAPEAQPSSPPVACIQEPPWDVAWCWCWSLSSWCYSCPAKAEDWTAPGLRCSCSPSPWRSLTCSPHRFLPMAQAPSFFRGRGALPALRRDVTQKEPRSRHCKEPALAGGWWWWYKS